VTKGTNCASITWAGYVLALCVLSNDGVMAQNVASRTGKTDTFGAVYLDPSVSTEKKGRRLVSRMTPEEKTGQLLSVAPAIPRLKVPAYNYWSEALHGLATTVRRPSFRRPSVLRRHGTLRWSIRWQTQSAPRRVPGIRKHCAKTGTCRVRDSRSGRPTSICFAILVGGAGRKPTGKIPISLVGSGSRL